MNILQFNVRLAEGGAAGVALDLHLRATKRPDLALCLWLRQRREEKRQPQQLPACD